MSDINVAHQAAGLPSKTEFIFNGFSPPSTQESLQECGVCWEISPQRSPPRTPVKLSCKGGHIFCISCIIASLKASSLCPLCRVPLYARERHEEHDSESSDNDTTTSSQHGVDYPLRWATGYDRIPQLDDEHSWAEITDLRRAVRQFQ